MSKNCAIKYSDIEAKTAKGEAEKTKLKVSSLIAMIIEKELSICSNL